MINADAVLSIQVSTSSLLQPYSWPRVRQVDGRERKLTMSTALTARSCPSRSPGTRTALPGVVQKVADLDNRCRRTALPFDVRGADNTNEPRGD